MTEDRAEGALNTSTRLVAAVYRQEFRATSLTDHSALVIDLAP